MHFCVYCVHMYANISESFPNIYCLNCILRPSLSWTHHFEIIFPPVCFKSPSMDLGHCTCQFLFQRRVQLLFFHDYLFGEDFKVFSK